MLNSLFLSLCAHSRFISSRVSTGLQFSYLKKSNNLKGHSAFSTMPQYKLSYFTVRGIGEPIRFILAMNNIPFEDKRVEWEEWAEELGNLKSEIGNGQLPVFEVDGKQLTQSLTITRYLARIYNLMPEDAYLAARCDEISDIVNELRLEFRPLIFEQDEEKKAVIKKTLAETPFPKTYKFLNKLVAETKGPFIAGENLSWGDLVLANWLEIWEDLVVTPEFLNSYPELKVLREGVFALPALSKYLTNRPKTWV